MITSDTGGPRANIAPPGLLGARVSLSQGGGKVLQREQLGSEVGYQALDSYGRLLDMHAKNTVGTRLFRAQYTVGVRTY